MPAGFLTGILTRMSVKMPAVILMSGAAALRGSKRNIKIGPLQKLSWK